MKKIGQTQSKSPLPTAVTYPHPYLSGWSIAWLPILPLLAQTRTEHCNALVGIIITQSQGAALSWELEKIIKGVDEQTLIGIDLSGIANMDKGMWKALGPDLHERVMSGTLGKSKRLLYMVGENTWLANDLQWAFEKAARDRVSTHPAGTQLNVAVLAPDTTEGYCGVLAPIYADILKLVNQYTSMNSLELYQHLQRRYRLAPAHADQCLAVLSQLGLLCRHSPNHRDGIITYDLNAKGYRLSVGEDVIREKGCKLNHEPPLAQQPQGIKPNQAIYLANPAAHL